MLDHERPGIPHNAIAHPLMAFPIVWRFGQWLHDHTQEVVPSWSHRFTQRLMSWCVPSSALHYNRSTP